MGTIVSIIVGIICIGLGIYQAYATQRLFHYVKTKGGQETSPFFLMTMWSTVLITIGLIIAGLYLIFVLSLTF
ncbi:hypothetical protein [uncultured Enterococcus sp.]|uniref:hypothetical protein n=1 Tax=uncultured Enterococcus sp. TaxID=167972 RepID=UPI0025E28C31|nr:hypothetical protein [uncultured Enterococcus sp.]